MELAKIKACICEGAAEQRSEKANIRCQIY